VWFSLVEWGGMEVSGMEWGVVWFGRMGRDGGEWAEVESECKCIHLSWQYNQGPDRLRPQAIYQKVKCASRKYFWGDQDRFRHVFPPSYIPLFIGFSHH
jgi:hypothetical protein